MSKTPCVTTSGSPAPLSSCGASENWKLPARRSAEKVVSVSEPGDDHGGAIEALAVELSAERPFVSSEPEPRGDSIFEARYFYALLEASAYARSEHEPAAARRAFAMLAAPKGVSMGRMHLVELEDQPWFPTTLRDGGTAFLEFAERTSGHGRMLVAPLERALDATGETRLVDLCSGGGGPAASIADELAKRGRTVTVTLTDRYPNLPAFERAARESRGNVVGRAEPVDATAVPAELRGVRTIFNAFHHFTPEQARKVLADAVAQRQPIGVFEVVSREFPMLLGLLLTPITVTFSMPLWRPFRWPWLLWTWIVPVMQAFVLWDGLVSWLRIYGVDELRALVAEIDAPDWDWDIGTVKLGNAPLHGTYLVGYPKPRS